MGFAELIPGVSGGTIALILGIYKRLVEAISNINLTFLKGAFSRSFKQSWNQADLKSNLHFFRWFCGSLCFYPSRDFWKLYIVAFRNLRISYPFH